jgi:hypothetical protein
MYHLTIVKIAPKKSFALKTIFLGLGQGTQTILLRYVYINKLLNIAPWIRSKTVTNNLLNL